MSSSIVPIRPPVVVWLTLEVSGGSRERVAVRNVLYQRTGKTPLGGDEWATARGLIADLTREVGEWQAQDAYLAQLEGCDP